jgi:hypothetical protein
MTVAGARESGQRANAPILFNRKKREFGVFCLRNFPSFKSIHYAVVELQALLPDESTEASWRRKSGLVYLQAQLR